MYVPGFSVVLKDFVPPWNTGVLPRILFDESVSTTSWSRAELLVNLIATFPAVAVSLSALKASVLPLAARATVPPALLAGGAAGVLGFVDAGACDVGSLPVAPRR